MCHQWWYGKKKSKPGLPAAFAQTWSSLSQAFFPTPLHRSWAGTEHFQLILSFLKCLLLFFLPFFFFFFNLQRRWTVNLKSFISFHSDSLINKVFYNKNKPVFIFLLRIWLFYRTWILTVFYSFKLSNPQLLYKVLMDFCDKAADIDIELWC